MRERVVHRLVAADCEPAVPGAFNQGGGRCDQQEQIHDLAESRQQVAAGFVRIGRKAVEPEAIDQQMRYPAALRLARHVAIELLIDDPQSRRR